MKKKYKTYPVKHPRRNGVYYVSNKDLGITKKDGSAMGGGHGVILVSKDKVNNICEVKTITSVLKENNNVIDLEKLKDKLNMIKEGKLVPIPKDELNSKYLSGVRQDSKVINCDKLKKTTNKNLNFKYPSKYGQIIHDKKKK